MLQISDSFFSLLVSLWCNNNNKETFGCKWPHIDHSLPCQSYLTPNFVSWDFYATNNTLYGLGLLVFFRCGLLWFLFHCGVTLTGGGRLLIYWHPFFFTIRLFCDQQWDGCDPSDESPSPSASRRCSPNLKLSFLLALHPVMRRRQSVSKKISHNA